MRAAWKLTDADEGMKQLEQLANFLEHEHVSSAEGMAEIFPVQRMNLPPSLYKCVGTTTVIESPQSGVEKRTNNVTRWRTAEMVQRWVASAWLLSEKHFRKAVGHKDFRAISVILGRELKLPAALDLQLGLGYPLYRCGRGFCIWRRVNVY